MTVKNLGIIGGGQLGSMLSSAAKKLDIKTVVYSDDKDAPAQNFCNDFIFGKYDDKQKIQEFIQKVDLITYEFENIPYETLNEMNKLKPVLPKPSVNRLIQHRIAEKDFINKLNIRTTRYQVLNAAPHPCKLQLQLSIPLNHGSFFALSQRYLVSAHHHPVLNHCQLLLPLRQLLLPPSQL